MSDSRHLAVDLATSSEVWVRVALDVPLEGPFDYRCAEKVGVGDRVIVSFGRRKMVGMVVELPTQPGCDPSLIKSVEAVLSDIGPMSPSWLRFAKFAADYYQRPLGEVLLPALPVTLRSISAYQGKRSAGGPVERLDKKRNSTPKIVPVTEAPELNQAQQNAVNAIVACESFRPFLLYGVTGSGKTEVYLHAAAQTLARGQRVLMLVPEINLTPQFEQSLRGRLEPVAGPGGVAVLHSALSDGERLKAWLRVQRGEAKVVLGTRRNLQLIGQTQKADKVRYTPEDKRWNMDIYEYEWFGHRTILVPMDQWSDRGLYGTQLVGATLVAIVDNGGHVTVQTLTFPQEQPK
jgi:primosomal protein N' (replication factor Y)